MKIVNDRILEDFKANKLISLNLGSGYEKKEGFYPVQTLPDGN